MYLKEQQNKDSIQSSKTQELTSTQFSSSLLSSSNSSNQNPHYINTEERQEESNLPNNLTEELKIVGYNLYHTNQRWYILKGIKVTKEPEEYFPKKLQIKKPILLPKNFQDIETLFVKIASEKNKKEDSDNYLARFKLEVFSTIDCYDEYNKISEDKNYNIFSQVLVTNITPEEKNQNFYTKESARKFYVQKHYNFPNLYETIKKFWINKSTLTLEDYRNILKLMDQLIIGLKIINKKNYVHRDIKPDNILIQDWSHPIILDFGLVKSLSKDSAGVSSIGERGTIGTKGYIAPENSKTFQNLVSEINLEAIHYQLQFNRSDIYGFGKTIYELSTNHDPYLERYNKNGELRTDLENVHGKFKSLNYPDILVIDFIYRCITKNAFVGFKNTSQFFKQWKLVKKYNSIRETLEKMMGEVDIQQVPKKLVKYYFILKEINWRMFHNSYKVIKKLNKFQRTWENYQKKLLKKQKIAEIQPFPSEIQNFIEMINKLRWYPILPLDFVNKFKISSRKIHQYEWRDVKADEKN